MVASTTIALSGTNLVTLEKPERLRDETISRSTTGLMQLGSLVSGSSAVLTVPKVPSISAQLGSRWTDYVSRRLAQLRRGEGDFTGLMRPTNDVIERARSVSASLFQHDTPTPSVVPSEDGEVRFFWHKAGWMLEIIVGLEDVSIWAHQPSSGEDWSGSLAEFRPQVSGLLELLAKD
jgi:hypothetical protein